MGVWDTRELGGTPQPVGPESKEARQGRWAAQGAESLGQRRAKNQLWALAKWRTLGT